MSVRVVGGAHIPDQAKFADRLLGSSLDAIEEAEALVGRSDQRY
jgi:hypothetical protein